MMDRRGSRRLWRAPAKVNLTLHILGRRSDGWHELDSIVAFAGCSDWLRFEPGAELSLSIDGSTATAAGEIGDNLILRAARALAERTPGLRIGRFHLTKNLPVAAGLGGGSSDAAAALRALAQENGLSDEDPRLRAAAESTGADVPVCLTPRARRMGGRGEILGPLLGLPPLFAVLANPRVAVATPAVFVELGFGKGASSGLSASPSLNDVSDRSAAIAVLRRGRNDMQAAACALQPAVSRVLEALSALPGASLVRMSGSGATCFALFERRSAAAQAAASLASKRPDWWVTSTVLR
jgi:4-diphosphocytidyl-2-C-methyl-D-erythritol kinase